MLRVREVHALPSSGDSLTSAQSAGVIIKTVHFVAFFLSVQFMSNSRTGATVNLDVLEIKEGRFNPERSRVSLPAGASCSGITFVLHK